MNGSDADQCGGCDYSDAAANGALDVNGGVAAEPSCREFQRDSNEKKNSGPEAIKGGDCPAAQHQHTAKNRCGKCYPIDVASSDPQACAEFDDRGYNSIEQLRIGRASCR